ncbi:hypothetical protein G4G31_19195 [Massilia sp. Se16.2.3]|nr:hypothetical protein G4G31_19195 [Massilia sp. Se16.2.3]
MPQAPNMYLLAGAALSACAALLHLAIIAGGPAWYRFFGAGEDMAAAAARGRIMPAPVTLAIAAVLGAWSAYALAGAGAIPPLPLLRPAPVLITAIYLVRAVAFAPAMHAMGQPMTPFVVWSSLICLGFGIVHLIGLVQRWPAL